MASLNTPELNKLRSHAAVTSRYRRRDDPERLEAWRDYKAAALEDYVARVVNEAPALTDAQRNRIASLLRPVA